MALLQACNRFHLLGPQAGIGVKAVLFPRPLLSFLLRADSVRISIDRDLYLEPDRPAAAASENDQAQCGDGPLHLHRRGSNSK